MTESRSAADAGAVTVPLQLTTTQNAAYTSSDLPDMSPCNWATVYGPEGHTADCSVGSGGEIWSPDGKTSYGTGPYSPTLEFDPDVKHGLARFRITAKDSTFAAAEKLLAVTVFAQDRQDPSNQAPAGSATFQEFYDGGDTHFVGYNYTSGAPNDGVTPCSVYMQVDPEVDGKDRITYVLVTVDGHATIKNADPQYPQWRKVPLSSDGCATVDILDKTVEVVNVTLGLPQSPDSDSIGPFQIGFTVFPKT
ncbi:hypothetical protein [Paraburkholderia sediminicola]|uniref:hypothetical protein n=1 Tax=Paraburkholderia sediminicola TaxID=458836 RepID=UPI0038BC32E1